jgi:hypothetical protein
MRTPDTDAQDQVRAAFDDVRARQASGEIPKDLPLSARADWAYGNAVIENADVTRDMADRSVRQVVI